MRITLANTVAETGRNVVRREVNDPRIVRLTVGGHPSSDLVLAHPMVCSHAGVFERQGGGWTFRPLPLSGARIDDAQAVVGRAYPVADGMRIELRPFVMTIELKDAATSARRADGPREAEQSLLHDLHRQVVAATPYDVLTLAPRDRGEALLALENRVAELAEAHPLFDAAMIAHLAANAVRRELLNDLFARARPPAEEGQGDGWHADDSWRPLLSSVPAWEAQFDRVKAAAATRLDLLDDGDDRDPEAISRRIARVELEFLDTWAEVRGQLHEGGEVYLALRYLKRAIKDVVCGFGALEDLLQDPTISEIMVVGSGKIYAEQNGRIEKTGLQLPSDALAQSMMEIMVTSAPGGQLDRSRPMADVRLPNGSRVNVVIAPVAVSGPTATIRKPVARGFTIDALVRAGMLTAGSAAFLGASVADRRNVVVSGGVGSGKTTLLEVLSSQINPRERVGLIEDVAELALRHEHLVRMETLPPNVEGKGAIPVSALVRNALRMRFDRLIIGEVRDGAAFHMLQTMNMGSDGSMTTIHANSCDDVITRLIALAQEASPLPVETLHSMIGTAIDLFVHVERGPGGRRRVAQVAECRGIDPVTRCVVLKDIFRLNRRGLLVPTGRLPSYIDDLTAAGLLRREVFFEVDAATPPASAGQPS